MASPSTKLTTTAQNVANDGVQPTKADHQTRTPLVHTDQLSAAARQRYQLDKLMTRADVPVSLPEVRRKQIRPPPDMVKNNPGSSAGASSSDFHVYRTYRRHETTRLKQLDEETKEEQARQQYELKRLATQQELEAQTAKKRAKRQRRKKTGNTNPVTTK
ncbi:hypothetical protein IWQ61_000438 [Dispira simplex]|nr:hypothetical protein IWQ61_000438 [Dispira simplex]